MRNKYSDNMKTKTLKIINQAKVNKFGNPEPAKALSWVVDKKMQEL